MQGPHPTYKVEGIDNFEGDGGEIVIVTGAAGFIGSNLTNELAERGKRVYAVDDGSFGSFANIDDRENVKKMCNSVTERLPWSIFEDAECVYHLAAKSSTKMHERSPIAGCDTNVSGFVRVMERCVEFDIDDVVYASSSTVYGVPEITPTHEHVNLNPTTRYAASKAARERYAVAYREMGVNVAGSRFFSTYQGYEHNEGHKGEHGNIISMFAEQMANGEQPVVYGDGTQTRDFIHVSDVVRALIELRGVNGTYNVCRGIPVEFNDIVDHLNDALGTDIEPEYIDPPLDGEYVDEQEGDPTKLKRDTDWKPQVNVADGIQRVVEPYL